MEFYVAEMDVSLIRCHSLSFVYSTHYTSSSAHQRAKANTPKLYWITHTRTLSSDGIIDATGAHTNAN